MSTTQNLEIAQVGSFLNKFLHLADAADTPISPDAVEVALDNFTRLIEGENRFRLLDAPIYGAEVWFRRVKTNEETGEVELYDDGSPKMESSVKRYRAAEPIMPPAEFATWQKDKPRKFMAMLVYNYRTKVVEVLAVSNGKLFDQLWNMLRDKEQNNAFRADLKIQKSPDGPMRAVNGKSMQLYNHQVGITKENQPPAELIEAIKRLPFPPDLDALFAGDDPFAFHQATEYTETNALPEGAAKGIAAVNEAGKKAKR